MHLLYFRNGNIIKVLHYLLMSIDNIITILSFRSMDSRSDFLVLFAWLPWLECKFPDQILLGLLVHIVVAVELVRDLVEV